MLLYSNNFWYDQFYPRFSVDAVPRRGFMKSLVPAYTELLLPRISRDSIHI